jgi:hypothetical protein
MTNEKNSPLFDSEKSSETSPEESRRNSLGRLSVGEENRLKVREDLDQMFIDKRLAQIDAGKQRTEELLAIRMDVLSPAELQKHSNLLQADFFSSPEIIEELLSLDKIGDIAIEGRTLKEILDNGITSPEQRKMMQTGIIFLKRRKYKEAVEWWLLNRPENTPTDSRLHLMLTLFLALTYKLSGNEEQSNSALLEAKNNRSFKKLE